MSRSWSKNLSPNATVGLLLAAWWLLNLLQAALTGLADDEAYYWYFAHHLDWGYFDHPPVVALLVRLSLWVPISGLCVRLFTTLLQPAYLYIFWLLIKPERPRYGAALAYVAAAFSMPLLQLYGFIATPDAPLLFGSVLFFAAFKSFAQRQSVANTILLGLSAALLGYSKYHGLLVVVLAVASRLQLLRKPQLYVAGAVALVAFVPHLLWQWRHDWVSFSYHLVGRNREWHLSFTTEYLLNLLLVFNPLWLWHYWRGVKPMATADPLRRALAFVGVGFPVFFLFSTLRGHAQPQCLLPAVLPSLCAVSDAEAWQGSRRYFRVVVVASAILFVAVRVLAVTNPFGLKGQIWNNEKAYKEISDLADGRPVVFMASYTAPAKYMIYTGGEAYSAPFFFGRGSQWQYDTTDHTFAGREVLVANFTNTMCQKAELANGQTLRYCVIENYKPMRELRAAWVGPAEVSSQVADSGLNHLDLTIAVVNPYPYDIYSTERDTIRVQLSVKGAERSWPSLRCVLTDTLVAHDTTLISCHMAVPAKLQPGQYEGVISIGYKTYMPSACSKPLKVRFEKNDKEVVLLRYDVEKNM